MIEYSNNIFSVEIGEISANGLSFLDGTINGGHWTCRLSWLNKIAEKWGLKCFDEDSKQQPEHTQLGRPEKIIEIRQFSTLIFWRHLLKYCNDTFNASSLYKYSS